MGKPKEKERIDEIIQSKNCTYVHGASSPSLFAKLLSALVLKHQKLEQRMSKKLTNGYEYLSNLEVQFHAKCTLSESLKSI